MALSSPQLRKRLDLLAGAMANLRHDGRFHEPNLDGTPGDYISFESWEWPQGVGLYGLVQLWRVTGEKRLLELIEAWYARHLSQGLPSTNINTTAPMLALSILWSHTRDTRWQTALDEWANKVVRDIARTPEGGLQHDVSDRINSNELWDDTLFMAGLFLASYGQASGRRELVDESIRQFLVHARYLSDPRTGLWFHGWTFNGRNNFAEARWARGNAWITAGILDLFELAQLPDSVRLVLSGILTSQVEALLPLQTPSGAWRTLLDDPSSYEEISATAGFGYALLKAGRLGFSDSRWRNAGNKALEAVLANIGDDGTVANVSYGTRMGHDLQFYRHIPLQPTGYGQALAILCLVEAYGQAQVKEKAA